MAQKKAKAKAKAEAEAKKSRPNNTIVMAVLIVIIAMVAIFSLLVFASPTAFSTFKKNFNSAPQVAIYVNDTNSTAFSYEIACSSALIQELSGPTAAHRNASTINLFVLYNATQCVYNPGDLGTIIKNYTYTSAGNCLNYSKSMPSIFIGYAAINNTKSIQPTKYYFIGNTKLLSLCGIAYDMT